MGNQSKNRQIKLHQARIFLHSKGSSQQSHRIGEKFANCPSDKTLIT